MRKADNRRSTRIGRVRKGKVTRYRIRFLINVISSTVMFMTKWSVVSSMHE